MIDKNNLITYEPVNDFMVFKWGDGLESYIKLKTLRENAHVQTVKAKKMFSVISIRVFWPLNESSYLLKGLQPVGLCN